MCDVLIIYEKKEKLEKNVNLPKFKELNFRS